MHQKFNKRRSVYSNNYGNVKLGNYQLMSSQREVGRMLSNGKQFSLAYIFSLNDVEFRQEGFVPFCHAGP